jgi:F0F1-type ATP synthase membrane subunit a
MGAINPHLFVFIFRNLMGMIPVFDVLGVLNHWVFHASPDSFFGRLLHGGSTATANFNVTGGLAIITFFAIIVAGSKAHGFLQHWKNIVPHGLAWPIYIILIPIEIIGMFVKPFALTMRLAANMTGGHIAILAILSLVFIFRQMFESAMAGMAVGLVAVPLAVGISALELIRCRSAHVFTLFQPYSSEWRFTLTIKDTLKDTHLKGGRMKKTVFLQGGSRVWSSFWHQPWHPGLCAGGDSEALVAKAQTRGILAPRGSGYDRYRCVE